MTRSSAASPRDDELIASLREGMDILAGRAAPSRLHPGLATVDAPAISTWRARVAAGGRSAA